MSSITAHSSLLPYSIPPVPQHSVPSSHTVSQTAATFGPKTTEIIGEDILSQLPHDTNKCLTITESGEYISVKVNKFLDHPVQVKISENHVAIALPLIRKQGENEIYYVELFYQPTHYGEEDRDVYDTPIYANGVRFSDLTHDLSNIKAVFLSSDRIPSYGDLLLEDMKKLFYKENIETNYSGQPVTIRLFREDDLDKLPKMKKVTPDTSNNSSFEMKTPKLERNLYNKDLFFRNDLSILTGETPYSSPLPSPAAASIPSLDTEIKQSATPKMEALGANTQTFPVNSLVDLQIKYQPIAFDKVDRLMLEQATEYWRLENPTCAPKSRINDAEIGK